MPEATKLGSDELQRELPALAPWRLDEAGLALVREYRFRDFMQAFAFMTEMAIWSEKQDHHPEWFNVYNRVRVTLSTHDAGGVTSLDLAWARHADAAYARMQG